MWEGTQYGYTHMQIGGIRYVSTKIIFCFVPFSSVPRQICFHNSFIKHSSLHTKMIKLGCMQIDWFHSTADPSFICFVSSNLFCKYCFLMHGKPLWEGSTQFGGARHISCVNFFNNVQHFLHTRANANNSTLQKLFVSTIEWLISTNAIHNKHQLNTLKFDHLNATDTSPKWLNYIINTSSQYANMKNALSTLLSAYRCSQYGTHQLQHISATGWYRVPSDFLG